MIRNLKALGLAMAAMLALGAVAASAASAQQGQITSDGPVTLIGKQSAGGTNALTAFGNETTCTNPTYTGHEVGGSNPLPSGSTEATITPHYGQCSTAGFSSTVDMNGCDYRFKVGETTGEPSTHTYGVDAFVVCPQNQHIQVTIFTGSNHDQAPWCTSTITEKTTAYTGLHATDLTNGHLRVSGTLKEIEAHRDRGPHSTFFPCSSSTTTSAELHLDIQVEGQNTEGGTTEISLSH